MAIALVQNANGDTGSAVAGTFNIVLGAAPTAGNTVFVAVAHHRGSLIYMSSVTGITWTRYQSQAAAGTMHATMFIGRVFSGASATLTVSVCAGSANNAMSGVAAEFSGTNLHPDQEVGAIGSSTSPASGATPTTTVTNELWLGCISVNLQSSVEATTNFSSPTNSFTLLDQRSTNINTAAADRAIAFFYQIVSSTGTPNVGATSTSNSNWVALCITFHEISTTVVQLNSIGGN